MKKRFARIGDRHQEIDKEMHPLDALLELSKQQGEGDAPWPPYYRRKTSEKFSSARKA
jgi:hypothetical protein